MTTQPDHKLSVSDLERIIAHDVSLEVYMEQHSAYFREWIEGAVIDVSPTTWQHSQIVYYLQQLIKAYFELRPIGVVSSAPFVMRLETFPNRRREPDLLVILKTNPATLHESYLDGAADLCIEVVSEDSVARDHGDKFYEYEQGGVGEYWIIDPLRKECRFYVRDESGRYVRQSEQPYGHYTTSVLPGLRLNIELLWQDTMPGPAATAQAVREMLG
jgi:Uma2 family endonuclease